MVRKDEVLAAGVDVEGFAQMLEPHGRTFDVPAGPSRAPGAVPGGLSLLRRLPESEVEGVLFSFVYFDAGACLQFFEVPFGELAVLLETGYAAIHVASDGISVSLLYEALDDFDHLRNVLRGLWLHIRPADAQALHVLLVGGDIFGGNLGGTDALFLRAVDDLVVDIGEIPHVRDVEPSSPKVALDQVKGHGPARMAKMGKVVDRHAARVHGDLARLDGDEVLFLSRER